MKIRLKRRWILTVNKRPLCGAAVLLCIGIWTAAVRAWYAYLCAAGALFLIIFLFRRGSNLPLLHRTTFAAAVLFTGFLVSGYILNLNAEADSRWYEAYDLDDASVTLRGTVYAIEEDDGVQSVYLKHVTLTWEGKSFRTNRILLRAYVEDEADEMPLFDALRIGNVVRVKGTVSYFSQARNPGNFDARSYYRIKGIDFRVTPTTLSVTDDGVNRFADLMRQVKMRLQAVLAQCLSADAYGVLNTMVLGDDAQLSGETQTLYREAGISHILAISGLHVSIVGMLLYRLLRRRGCSYLISSLPSAALVYGFAVMSGMGIAVQRALIMFLVMLIGNLFGHAYDALSALALAAILILVRSPLLLFSASFQLSFSAVIGVGAVFPALKNFLNVRSTAAENFLLSFSIQLTTIPVTLYYYFEIPVFSLPANFILVPFVSILLVDGIAGALAGLLCLPAARILLLPAELILKGYAIICTWISKIPGHMWVIGRPGWVRMILYYLLLAGAVFFMIRHADVKNEMEEEPQTRPGRKENTAALRRCLPGLLRTAALTALLLCTMALHLPAAFSITMIDVGQGDGILVRSAGTNVFIDGGSSDVTDVGTWRILPYLKSCGIGSIDIWMVTHTDSDHTSGLVNLLESGYPIDTLLFAAGITQDEDLTDLLTLAEENGTRVLYLSRGGTIAQGEALWTLLWPEDENDDTDKNEASMVMLLTYGDFTALFTGDITEETEADLLSSRILKKYLSKDDRINGIDLLKVAHHGSKYSTTEDFLDLIAPQTAIISAGVDNMYGHPSAETLIRLSATADEIYVTSETGAITIMVNQDSVMQVQTFLE